MYWSDCNSLLNSKHKINHNNKTFDATVGYYSIENIENENL